AEVYSITAVLDDAQTIPLKKLMATRLPGVPAPADLTINQMVAVVAPGAFYELSGALADAPATWDIALGPATLRFGNLLFDFTLQQGGSATGMFRGDVAIGDATLSGAVSVPGEFSLRGGVERI